MTCAAIPCGNECLVVGTYSVCINGYDLGSTTGGLTLTRNAEFVDVRNDQSCSRQFRYLKQQDWMFKTTLQCVTLDKLRLIYGMGTVYTDPAGNIQPSMPTPNILNIAENQGDCGIGSTEEHEVVICGPGPGCGCRLIKMNRVLITPETLEYTITKDNPVQLEVEFTVLADCETGIIISLEDNCESPECLSGPIPLPPVAFSENNGTIPEGEEFTGQLSTFAGSDDELFYEFTDPDNPCINDIILSPDGTYTINPQ